MAQTLHPHLFSYSRRLFLGQAALGAAAVAGVLPTTASASAVGQTEALLLSCMDYRLVDDTVRYMDGRALTNKYDHVVLAGASLGALQDKKRSWGPTFWEHLDVAIQLHGIHRVMVLDHRDCGAYKVFLGERAVENAAAETKAHSTKLRAFAKLLKKKHKHLAIELLLMDLQGAVEVIPA